MLTSQFRSKTILMTAATSGIGKAAARMYGEAGAQTVILNGRNAETGAKVSAELAALNPGTQYRFIQGDIGVAAQIGRLFSEMRDIAPRLDVFVHCGGAQIAPTFFKHLDPSTYQEQIDGHFAGFMHCCRGALSMMN